jgi:hypothetical protein
LGRPQGSACDIGAIEVVLGPDAITSVDSAVAIDDSPFSFTVTTIGSPYPSFAIRGKLPKGLRLASSGDGDATVSGTPTKIGAKTVTLTATFGVGSTATTARELFSLRVVRDNAVPAPSPKIE